MIVIAPAELSSRLVRGVAGPVMVFESLDELDRWRSRLARHPTTIGVDLRRELRENTRSLARLPRKLLEVLDWASRRSTVPTLAELQAHWPSRRSFYRTWTEAIDEPPSVFLRRVRGYHARRLIELGMAPKEAAARAGFTSTAQMRRTLARKT